MGRFYAKQHKGLRYQCRLLRRGPGVAVDHCAVAVQEDDGRSAAALDIVQRHSIGRDE